MTNPEETKTKQCNGCNEHKPMSKFTAVSKNVRTNRIYYASKCKACSNHYVKVGRKKPLIQRDPALKRTLQTDLDAGMSVKDLARVHDIQQQIVYLWLRNGHLTRPEAAA